MCAKTFSFIDVAKHEASLFFYLKYSSSSKDVNNSAFASGTQCDIEASRAPGVNGPALDDLPGAVPRLCELT